MDYIGSSCSQFERSFNFCHPNDNVKIGPIFIPVRTHIRNSHHPFHSFHSALKAGLRQHPRCEGEGPRQHLRCEGESVLMPQASQAWQSSVSWYQKHAVHAFWAVSTQKLGEKKKKNTRAGANCHDVTSKQQIWEFNQGKWRFIFDVSVSWRMSIPPKWQF